MKNVMKFLIPIAAIVGIFVIFYIANKTSNENNNSGVTFINVSELEKKINNKDDFVLVLSQDGCSHCEAYAPILKKVVEENKVTIYDINLTKVKQNEVSRLNAIVNVSGTPTTVFFKNGEETTTLDRINGSTTKDKLVTKLKKLGYIKGEKNERYF